MSNASDEQIAAARAYEDLFVPALFREWATRVAEAAQVGPGQRVLDVACGTGVLAREVARRVGDSGAVAGIDPAAGMLGVARELAPGVEFREGPAEALPWPDGSFDAVVSQFGLMFFADRERALREMVRVLRPGGRLVVAVWAALEDIPAFVAEVALLEGMAGREAADALRLPFALGDRDELERLVGGVGLRSLEATTLPGMARFPSVRSLVEADLRGWLPLVGVHLDEEPIGRILDEAETAMAEFVTRDGALHFEIPAHVVTGVRA